MHQSATYPVPPVTSTVSVMVVLQHSWRWRLPHDVYNCIYNLERMSTAVYLETIGMAARKNAPVRRRNAANTREAILASARTAFTNSGYDGAGVREIASGAGVTAMLVNRYFGSKERLFAEVVARTMAVPVILTPDILESGNPGEAI